MQKWIITEKGTIHEPFYLMIKWNSYFVFWFWVLDICKGFFLNLSFMSFFFFFWIFLKWKTIIFEIFLNFDLIFFLKLDLGFWNFLWIFEWVFEKILFYFWKENLIFFWNFVQFFFWKTILHVKIKKKRIIRTY